MDLSRRMKRLLLCLLVSLHLFFRYPVTPRSVGSTDSFFVMGMTFSLKKNSGMPWLDNVFSYAGLYPFSYPSGGSAGLAAVWSVSGLGIDESLYVFNLVFSLAGLFGVFMLGSSIKRNFLVGYSGAFAFSVSPLIFRYTFWMLSARALFVCLLPVFVWFLFRTLSRRHGLRYGLCAAVLFPVMMFVHHMGLFLPALFLGYVLAHLTSRAMNRLKLTSIYSKDVSRSLSFIILAFFVFLIFLQTIMDSFYSPDLQTFQAWYLKDEGNPLVTVLNIGIFYTVSVGVLMLCGIFGLANLTAKNDKKETQWGILLVLLVYSYFVADQLYLVVFLIPLITPVIGYGVYVIVSRIEIKPGFALAILAALLLTALPHTAYISSDWIDNKNPEYGFRRWAYEDTVSTSIYLGRECQELYICNDGQLARRIKAYSGQEGMPFGIYEYPVVSDDVFDSIESERVDLVDFYFDKDQRKEDVLWRYEWKDENASYERRYDNIANLPVTDPRADENLTVAGTSLAVVSHYFPDQVGTSTRYYALRFSWFFASLPGERYRLYENGHETVYQL